MNPLRKRMVRWVIIAAALLAAQFFLGRWLAAHQVVSTLLSAGSHVPLHLLALAGFFVCLRLCAVVLLPAAAIASLTLGVIDCWRAWRAASPASTR